MTLCHTGQKWKVLIPIIEICSTGLNTTELYNNNSEGNPEILTNCHLPINNDFAIL